MEELYEKYSKVIYKYIYSLSKDSFLAEELVQETFYSAIKNINKISNNSNIKSWLYKIAKNKYIDYLRKQKRRSIESIDTTPNLLISDDSMENDLIEKDELFCFYKSIQNLDEITQEVIYLKIRSELSFKEIATILNKSEEWARVTFYRGKMKLKEELNNGNRK